MSLCVPLALLLTQTPADWALLGQTHRDPQCLAMGATQSLDFLICIASGVGLGAQKVPSYTIVQGA